MNKDTDLSAIRTLCASFSGRLLLAHTTLEQVRLNENLSPAGLLNVKTLDLCHHHMNHICQFIEHIAEGNEPDTPYDTISYDSEQLLSGITEAFTKTISGYSSVTPIFASKLKTPCPVLVNKTNFETIILNLLYSCLKINDLSDNRKNQITLSVSDTKKNIIFHIRTNSTITSSELLEDIVLFYNDDEEELFSRDASLALALEIADKFISEANGTLSFKPLKSGTRYDISLPKLPDIDQSVMCSSGHYTPSYKLFEETFAEFKLNFLASQYSSEDLEL